MMKALQEVKEESPISTAERLSHGDIGEFDYLLASAATGRDALHAASRFVSMNTSLSLFFEESEVVGRLVDFEIGSRTQANERVREFLFARILFLLRTFVDRDLRAISVDFRHARTKHTEIYESFFGCHVSFSSDRDSLVLLKTPLMRPSTAADANLFRILERFSAVELEDGGCEADPSRWTNIIRKLIYAELRAERPIETESIAKLLGISSRSLRGRLARESSSFISILDGERKKRAAELIANENLKLEEVGFKLGFSDPSSFNRAFRRWNGTTPGAFRSENEVRALK